MDDHAHELAGLAISRSTFPDGGSVATLRLVDGKTTPNGVMIATYQPAAAVDPAAERDHQPHSRW